MNPSESFTPNPPPSQPAPLTMVPAAAEFTPAAAQTPAPRAPALAALAWSLTGVLLVFMVAAWSMPWILAHWRSVEARADADAAYQKRRAELRAEAEAANEQLQLLDKRAVLVSFSFREVVRKVGPCVVNLTSYTARKKGRFADENEWQEALDPETGEPMLVPGAGSGFIVEPGWILTNYHVVAHAKRVRVTFASGQSVMVSAERIKSDPLTDLAAIALPPPGIQRDDQEFKAEFADSGNVERGDLVLALGNPLGLKHSVTHGIISAKGRLLGPLDVAEVLQTDAPINKGNSGGPLFNHSGQVVGVNFAIASDTGFSAGIGFAIPSNIAKDVFQQLRDHGEVIRGFLGIELEEVLPGSVAALGKGGAARIQRVVLDQPAANAGLRGGDVVLTFNKETLSPVNPVRHLRQLIMETKVGEAAEIEILRGAGRQTLQVTIGKRPSDAVR
jgi:S1-C subfamily serine protease